MSEQGPEAGGPALTISRDFGCHAGLMAKMIVERLNRYHLQIGAPREWDMLNKEILELSARELQTDSRQIEEFYNAERGGVEDFLRSMTSSHYQPDWKVMDATRKVIRTLAFSGNIVIVGRAGAQITRDMNNILHVKLTAPYKWRVQQVMERFELSEKAAAEKVKETDHKRQRLVDMYTKEAPCDYCYDVIYNMQYFNHDQVVANIVHLMQQKKLV